MQCTCKLLWGAVAIASAARVHVEEASRLAETEDQVALDFGSLVEKHDYGHNVTFHVSIAHGTAVGRLHLQFGSGGTKITNQGFGKHQGKHPVSQEYWKPGSILGKDDEYAWEIRPEGHDGAQLQSFTFDHGVSDLVFGDLLDGNEEFYRMEFEEAAYAKVQPNNWLFQQQPVDAVVAQHLREEIKESSLNMGQWHEDGYFSSRGMATMSYTPRLMAKKSVWEEAGTKFNKVMMQRPAIMDIDVLFGEPPNAKQVRKSFDVNKDNQYLGAQGIFPSLGKCIKSDSMFDQALEQAGYFCGRTHSEQCSTEEECRRLGGRFKPKYCMKPKGGADAGGACGCCKDIGRNHPDSPSGRMSVQMHVEWLAPVVSKFQCVPVDAKWAKSGASSLFIGMGWGTEGDVHALDVDLSLVPLDKYRNYIKDKVVFFNNQAPQRLSCGKIGSSDYAMRAFGDDRSGDAPGDDELVKINLNCLSQMHPDIEAVVVVASIYKPTGYTWNMLDSVYMRFIAGGNEQRRSGNFYVNDAESLSAFIRLSGDATKADPSMENDGLAVGMLFKDANGDWAFAGLMEGLKGSTVLHSQLALERFMQGLTYPLDSWDDDVDAGNDQSKTAPCVRVTG